MSRARPEKEAGADLRSTPGRGMTFRDLCEVTCSEFGVNSVPPIYPIGELHERLLDEFGDAGMTPQLARRIAQNESAARMLLGESSEKVHPAPVVSLHEMFVHVLDSIAGVATAQDTVPSAEQIAQSCFAFACVWQRPWLRGLTASKLALRCRVSREAMGKRVQRVRDLYGIPQAKSDEQRAKLRAGRRRWLERPRPVVITRVTQHETRAA